MANSMVCQLESDASRFGNPLPSHDFRDLVLSIPFFAGNGAGLSRFRKVSFASFMTRMDPRASNIAGGKRQAQDRCLSHKESGRSLLPLGVDRTLASGMFVRFSFQA